MEIVRYLIEVGLMTLISEYIQPMEPFMGKVRGEMSRRNARIPALLLLQFVIITTFGRL